MKRLYRSESDRMISGVCGGLGEYFGIDATLIRFVFAGALIFGMGSPGVLYILLLLIMPKESQTDETGQMRIQNGFDEISEQARRAVEKVKEHLDSATRETNGHLDSTADNLDSVDAARDETRESDEKF